MDYKNDFVTRKRVEDDFVYFYVDWSPKYPVNRYIITKSVPARPGIFKLYYKDSVGKVRLFYMERVWYGGLRSEIRRASDPMEVSDRLRRAVLMKHSCYYSYTMIDSKLDAFDVLNAYSKQLLPKKAPPASSGRYEKIFIKD
ncbi:MAG: hypothetical protein PQJ61_01200 [Spirochaetales bacterium]|uniref:Uncharacterized protein n=1 Tax=Candidatus Thalassospirochaeta sargassi TaxID=3119039 RepID=A0AAJ1IDE3_9SPIO|nr:hypothetical protein [Spirochaetales bacterium]